LDELFDDYASDEFLKFPEKLTFFGARGSTEGNEFIEAKKKSTDCKNDEVVFSQVLVC
jgi:hypothetical protein